MTCRVDPGLTFGRWFSLLSNPRRSRPVSTHTCAPEWYVWDAEIVGDGVYSSAGESADVVNGSADGSYNYAS